MTRDDFKEELRQKIVEELTQKYEGNDMYMDPRQLAQKRATELIQNDDYVDACWEYYQESGLIRVD